MGLDLVELAMAVEDEFDLVIDDKDAGYLNTPGDVANYVFSRLYPGKSREKGKEFEACLSQVRFHRLRRILMETFGIARNDVKLNTPIEQILKNKISQWKKLNHALGSYLLKRPRAPFYLLSCTVFVSLFTPINLGVAVGPSVAVSLLVSSFTAAILYGNMNPAGFDNLADKWQHRRFLNKISIFATQTPDYIKTVQDLVPLVKVPITPPNLHNIYQDILERIFVLTSDQLGVPIEKIQPDSDFVDDLGGC